MVGVEAFNEYFDSRMGTDEEVRQHLQLLSQTGLELLVVLLLRGLQQLLGLLGERVLERQQRQLLLGLDLFAQLAQGTRLHERVLVNDARRLVLHLLLARVQKPTHLGGAAFERHFLGGERWVVGIVDIVVIVGMVVGGGRGQLEVVEVEGAGRFVVHVRRHPRWGLRVLWRWHQWILDAVAMYDAS